MKDTELAASFAMAHAKKAKRSEVGPDELLLGCLRTVSQFGMVRLGSWTFDLEELGVDWLHYPERSAVKAAYSQAAVDLFARAARIAKADGAATIRVDHLLAAFAPASEGLMGDWKRTYGITSAGWRAAVAQLRSARLCSAQAAKDASGPGNHGSVAGTVRDYLTPEEAAEALGIHVQTLRAYVRSGKLPALRLAGERAIRIRRRDLETVLEPLVPRT
ncbi:MAG: helix-turn-helix domain-containing protein [Bryobacteraceae bacterium]|jgi:excisionase family DNA binding protein